MGPVLFQLPALFQTNLPRLDDRVIRRLETANVALCFHDWRERPVDAPVTVDFVSV